MLPATYQLPAAGILVLGGLLACFAGYRLFRVVLGVYGFIIGALLASSMMAPGDTFPMIVAAILGGVIGAVLLNLAYFAGVALVGAGAAAMLLYLVWSHVGRGEPHIAFVIAAAVVGAIVAVWLQRIVIIVVTAFGGAWTAIVGGVALLAAPCGPVAAAPGEVWIPYPLSAGQRPGWAMVAWVLLGVAGLAVQMRGKHRPAPARAVRRRK